MNRPQNLHLSWSIAGLAALALGCSPQNAQLVEGTYTAFLATSTSTSLVKETVNLDGFEQHWQLDCRPFLEETKKEKLALQLENSILSDSQCKDLVDLGDSSWGGENTIQETWLLDDGYEVVQEKLDPWRGEALVTTEGDLQVGFHHRLPGDEDFRFLFTLDPDFQPTRCITEDGKVVAEDLDGDWVGNWSKTVEEVLKDHPDDPTYAMLADFPGGRVFFVNAFSYQINPDDPQTFDNPFWTLPNEWGASVGNGRFSEEYFSNRTVRFGEPILYANAEATDDQTASVSAPENVWYCNQGSDDESGGGDDCTNTNSQYDWQTRSEMISRAEDVANEVAEEMAMVDVPFRPIVEDNLWRPNDGNAPGLDGWAELHYNWVVIDASSDVVKGGNVAGAFQFLMDGSTSTSRYLINGKFDVERIRGDIWSNDDLQAIKAQEAADRGTPLCVAG